MEGIAGVVLGTMFTASLFNMAGSDTNPMFAILFGGIWLWVAICLVWSLWLLNQFRAHIPIKEDGFMGL